MRTETSEAEIVHMLANHATSAIGVVLVISVVLTASAQEQPTPQESGWQKLFRQHAAEYKVVIEGDDQGEVKLLPDPLLHWSQPVRGGSDGAVFLWVKAGRPVVIGTLFIWPMGNGKQGVSHELHSLWQQPLVATWNERKWTPPKDSIDWNPLSTASVPAKTPEQRLRQMREMTRAFAAESRDKNDRKWELRLLPRPIYRYQFADHATDAPKHDLLDGALFGFVEGTDLEVVLLVQARMTTRGAEWEYALARMSDFHLQVTLSDKLVWEVERSGYDNPRVPYYCSTVETRKSADEE